MRQISKIFFAPFCILLLISSISYGQVKIKERVEIEPSKTALGKTATTITGSHTIRAVVPWDASGDTPNFIRVMVQIENYCTGEIFQSEYRYNGIAEVSMTATTEGTYSASIHSQTNHWPTDMSWFDHWFGNFYIDVYVDGQLVATSDDKEGYPRQFQSIRPWFSKITLQADNKELACNGETDIIFGESSGCGPIIGGLNENGTLNLSITNGDGIVSFFDYSAGVDLGTSPSVSYEDRDDIRLKLNPEYFGEGDSEVTVYAEIGGYETSRTLYIRNTADEFEYSISAYPSGLITIFGSEAKRMQARASKGGYCFPTEYIPAGTKYNLVITEGAEHGVIGYKANAVTVSETGTELYELDHYSGSGRIYFEYKPHAEPLGKETVTINVSTTDPTIEPVDMNIVLMPNPLLAYADPGTIQPGDTSQFIIKLFDEAKGYIDFAEDHEFYVELWEGWEYGDIYSTYEDDAWWYWWDIPGPFSFISYDDIFEYEDEDTDEVTVVVYAETYIVYDDDGNPLPTITGSKDKIAGKRNKLPRDEVAILRREFREERKKEMQQKKGKGSVVYEKDNVTIKQLDYGSAPIETLGSTTVFTYFEITIKKEIAKEILLGETKYFGVQYKQTNEGTKYKIAEIPTVYGIEPNWISATLTDGWYWIKQMDVWGTDPIEVLETKSGVYWEDKWFDSLDHKNKPLNGNMTGMIRIIGRYWEDGEEDNFKVKLKAKETAEIEIKVVKPSKLDGGYSKVKNCFNKKFDIDSTIIFYSGDYGVPPQMIKAMVHQESSFTPAYVYEPYLDMSLQTSTQHKKTISDNQYFVKDINNIGSPSPPTDHRIRYWGNKKENWYDKYPEYSGSIYDVWNAHQSSYPLSIYGSKSAINTARQKQFRLILNEVKEENQELSEDEINSIALETAEERWPGYLENTYKGGMKNYKAQTRITASYGFMQMVYYFATTDRDYLIDDKHLPEYAMITDTSFKYGIEHLIDKISDLENFNSNSSWTKGYEETLLKSTIAYNGGKGYPIRLRKKILRYLPLKGED